jgi:hypothetical protein
MSLVNFCQSLPNFMRQIFFKILIQIIFVVSLINSSFIIILSVCLFKDLKNIWVKTELVFRVCIKVLINFIHKYWGFKNVGLLAFFRNELVNLIELFFKFKIFFFFWVIKCLIINKYMGNIINNFASLIL